MTTESNILEGDAVGPVYDLTTLGLNNEGARRDRPDQILDQIKKIREENKRIEEDTQKLYRKAKSMRRHPDKDFEALVRGFINDPKYKKLRRTLGTLAYVKRNYRDKLHDDYELFGGKLNDEDVVPLAYALLDAIIDSNPMKFNDEFKKRIDDLPHHRMKNLSKELCGAREKRFPRTSLKVETVERGFTETELGRFMAVIDDEADKAAFMLMATLGLRVGEFAALKGKDLEGDVLRIAGAKGGYSGYLRLPPSLHSIIPKKGPEERFFSPSKELRKRFAHYRTKAGLTEVYAFGEPGGRSGARRPLYRLSLHSLRHYAIQRVMRLTKDPDLTRRFARHRKLDTTLKYFRSSRASELENVIEALSPKFIQMGTKFGPGHTPSRAK